MYVPETVVRGGRLQRHGIKPCNLGSVIEHHGRCSEGQSPDPLQVFSVLALASHDKKLETPIRVGTLKYIVSHNWLDDPSPTMANETIPLVKRELGSRVCRYHIRFSVVV